ncbi:unnamed protein product [Allacma fusca]|uniref:Uncharacterized protein n=1 Tax=Allacma fusca TaxID=39272 RepID=A0A8J2LGW0_9HEXA|nr:unnamed protein product [Allacma fusca]
MNHWKLFQQDGLIRRIPTFVIFLMTLGTKFLHCDRIQNQNQIKILGLLMRSALSIQVTIFCRPDKLL